MLAETFLLPVPKPPSFAQASAAGAVARNFTKASIAGVSRNVTNRSPPMTTPLAPVEPAFVVGNGNTLKPEPGFAVVEDVITPATKSPSKTIAPFGGVENAFVTESLKPCCSAPEGPPARLPESPTTCAIVFKAVITDGSVHLILCADSAAYLAGPNVRK